MTFVASDKNPPYEDLSVIKIPFPVEKYEKLLKHCKFKNDKQLGYHQISQIFVNAIHKRLKGEWSLDDLSCIGNKFWAEREDKFDELGSALYAAGESTFYVRRIYRPKGKKYRGNFERWVDDLMQYYDKNKIQVID